MQTTRITTHLSRALMIALVVAPTLAAQEVPLFSWRGRVDDNMRITMHAGSVRSQVVSGDVNNTRGRIRRANVLPQQDGMVRVQLAEGRGEVTVLQQPNASNGYTTIVQVRDEAGGAAPYQFTTYFDPTVTFGNRGRRNRGRGNGNGNGNVTVSGGEVLGNISSGTSVLHWRGNVDGALQIALRGSAVNYTLLNGARPTGVTAQGGLPAGNGLLNVALRQGRGVINIVQQPTAENGYTAIVRVSDPEAGYGYYDFDLVWR